VRVRESSWQWAIKKLMPPKQAVLIGLLLVVSLAHVALAGGPRKTGFTIRGVPQTCYLYDSSPRQADPPAVLLVSGDGGWHGFIGEIAEHLAAEGYPVVGVDARDYLESLSKSKALEPGQVSSDFGTLIRFAREQFRRDSVVLVGWSEGAGLVVLGALDSQTRPNLRGVLAIGLPELNELAWRWKDSVIYITKQVPNEPTFISKDYVGRVAPLPLMMIQSTRDDFVPVAKAREIFARAQTPKQLVFVVALNHRFEGNRDAFWQAVDRALTWFDTLAAKPSH
jgi:alpha-beta hydrolase superfamily lysophospholipase